MSHLTTRNLYKSFGALAVTQDVTLDFQPGQRYAIIGPNGAGKTTFFNLLAGNLRPDSGSILLDGEDITRLDVTQRARIGIARSFQKNNLFTDLSVHDNLALACSIESGIAHAFWRLLSGVASVHRRALEIAEQIGLVEEAQTHVRHLSYGAQRQLEVGLALACRPKVLLLDEPTSGMSPQETARMDVLLNELPRTLTVIVIEHDMDIVLDYADHIAVLDYGRVLDQGPPDHIRASATVRERYLGDENLLTEGLAP
jgi:branched-chain amino acid transport system ATP-binding protein